jgi:hypothetical protein
MPFSLASLFCSFCVKVISLWTTFIHHIFVNFTEGMLNYTIDINE